MWAGRVSPQPSTHRTADLVDQIESELGRRSHFESPGGAPRDRRWARRLLRLTGRDSMSYQIRMIYVGLGRFWPPVKLGAGTDHLRHRLERETALGLDGLQGFEILEVAIGPRFIGQGPQPFRRLQLR
jgi:hypothetical protein